MTLPASQNTTFKGNNFVFGLDPNNYDSHFTFSDESDVREKFLNITPNDVFYDIGCGYGSYALPVLACGAKKAYCWALDQIHRDFLRESLLLNSFADKGQVFGVGLYSETGWYEQNNRTFSLTPQPGLMSVQKLDDMIHTNGLLDPTFIKLDTEGAELDILKGAEATLIRAKPRILVENHEFKVQGITVAVRDYLVGLGYAEVERFFRTKSIVDYSFFTMP
jgi:FkbM family methyltransferase